MMKDIIRRPHYTYITHRNIGVAGNSFIITVRFINRSRTGGMQDCSINFKGTVSKLNINTAKDYMGF